MDAALLNPPRRLSVPVDNRWGAGQMSVLDFGDAKRPVDLIFVHANGFNAATYRTLLAPLSASLRIWAPDLRGHGRTALPTPTAGRWSWADHRDDLIALLDAIDGPPVVMSGHSMGGTSSLLAAAERRDKVSQLVLLDPVIWTRAWVTAFKLPLLRSLPRRIPLAKGALRRRRLFESRDQALIAYRGRGAFKGWPEMALAHYLSDGLLKLMRGSPSPVRPSGNLRTTPPSRMTRGRLWPGWIVRCASLRPRPTRPATSAPIPVVRSRSRPLSAARISSRC